MLGSDSWGTWLSCEEFDRGQVFECDPYGKVPAQVRPALGSFKHEAVTVDMINNKLYLTEDLPDGGFYRFVPDKRLPDISSGDLEIASLVERSGKNYLSWSKISDPTAADVPVRLQVESYARFNGGEGIGFYKGQRSSLPRAIIGYGVMIQKPSEINIIYDFEKSDNAILSGVDNLTITPW